MELFTGTGLRFSGGESSLIKRHSSAHARQDYSSCSASASKGEAKRAYIVDKTQDNVSNSDPVAFGVILMLGMRR